MSGERTGSEISVIDSFEKTGVINLEKDLVTPIYKVEFPVRCFIKFHVPPQWDGQAFAIEGNAMSLFLNGTEVINILYEKDSGSKKVSADITSLLKNGENSLVVKVTVFNCILPHTWGKVFLICGNEMKILRTFKTRSLFEHQRAEWVLRV